MFVSMTIILWLGGYPRYCCYERFSWNANIRSEYEENLLDEKYLENLIIEHPVVVVTNTAKGVTRLCQK